MAYLCQNCGVVVDNAADVCNPVNEEYKHKSCSTEPAEVCDKKVTEMKYTCDCGNVSADPQHLCHPTKLT